ncbi:EGF-like domain-containing protein 7 [Camponotus floridanus]|uniref:EGF-like domain-containing protein 7 n=1 Tax=Camponotus floridanus TaxID=104421 RepID=E2AZZ4_CAMFO|nr:EGF-like domain-containing protein 7 [Camponotus floridanus]
MDARSSILPRSMIAASCKSISVNFYPQAADARGEKTSVRQEANGVQDHKLHSPKETNELGDSAYGDHIEWNVFFFHHEETTRGRRDNGTSMQFKFNDTLKINATHSLPTFIFKKLNGEIRRAPHQLRRRVCTRQAPITSHHRGKQIRLVYTEMTSSFFCCPGWSQVTHLSFGCNKPTCPALCLNGGICTSGKCTCPKGYTGNQCQTDVDECAIEKPCGQLCINTPGSYRCYCRAGFKLQQDGQSCRRNDTDENAFEARDLENDFHDMSTTKDPISSHDTENEVNNDDQDYEIILKRLTKLEKQVAKNRKKDTEASEMNTKVTLAIENINEMKRTVENVQLMQQEVYDMRSKMKQYEVEMRKIHHLMNRIAELETHLRIRCRSAIPINSGLLNF